MFLSESCRSIFHLKKVVVSTEEDNSHDPAHPTPLVFFHATICISSQGDQRDVSLPPIGLVRDRLGDRDV